MSQFNRETENREPERTGDPVPTTAEEERQIEEIVERITAQGYPADAIAAIDDRFHRAILQDLTEQNLWTAVDNLEKFTGLTEDDHRKLLEALIRKDSWVAANNLEKFTGLSKEDHHRLFEALVEEYPLFAPYNLEKFIGLSKKDHHRLFEALVEEYPLHAADNLEKFTGLTEDDHRRLFKAAVEQNPWAAANNLEKFRGILQKKTTEEDVRYLALLEGTGGASDRLTAVLSHAGVQEDPIRERYLLRMLLLFPEKYTEVRRTLGERQIPLPESFVSYEDAITTLQEKVEQLRATPLDPTQPSFGLEIESMNLDIHLELDLPVTTDREALMEFVRAFDNVQRRLRREMRSSLSADRELLGVYDSVHINIGIPQQRTADALSEDIEGRQGIYSLLTMLGLVYNPIGRVSYLYEKIAPRHTEPESSGLIEVHKHTTAHYAAKLQNRMWSFHLAVENAPFLDVVLRYLETITQQYATDPETARRKVSDLVEDIASLIREEEAEQPRAPTKEDALPKTYGELLEQRPERTWNVRDAALVRRPFPDSYLRGRNKIMRAAMHRLREEFEK